MEDLNFYARLAAARLTLAKKNIKKTGRNEVEKYNYYALSDIQKEILEVEVNFGLCSKNSVRVIDSVIFAVLEIVGTLPGDPSEGYINGIPLTQGHQKTQDRTAEITWLKRQLLINSYYLEESEDETIQSLEETLQRAKTHVKPQESTPEKAFNPKVAQKAALEKRKALLSEPEDTSEGQSMAFLQILQNFFAKSGAEDPKSLTYAFIKDRCGNSLKELPAERRAKIIKAALAYAEERLQKSESEVLEK